MSATLHTNVCPKQLIISCIKCQNYLTILPIYTTPNGYICGRCNVDTEPIKVRATAYENLANLFMFPCNNQHLGCKELLQFNDVTHESVCSFNGFKCPSATDTKCNETILLRNLASHYKSKHRYLIIPQYFQISQKQHLRANKLLIINEIPFIIQFYTINSTECSLALCYIENQQNYSKYYVEVIANNGRSLILNQHKIVEFLPEVFTEEDYTIINFTTIKQTLKSPNFNFQIHLIHDQPSPINNKELKTKEEKQQQHDMAEQTNIETINKPIIDEFLENLECVICKEYMSPPIFVCKTGHSICSECRKRIEQCPTCTANYEGTRNIILEKLTETIHYPCHNKCHGCEFVDKLVNLRIHEQDCMQITCRLSNLDNCTHRGSIHAIYQHYQQVHPQRLFNLNQEIRRNIKSTPLHDLYFVKYDGEVFNIGIDHSLCTMVLWSVEQIDLIDDNFEYKFIIDFIDKTNHGRILTISGLCQNFKQNDLFVNSSMKLPYYLLKPFVDENNVLHFKLDIKKL